LLPLCKNIVRAAMSASPGRISVAVYPRGDVTRESSRVRIYNVLSVLELMGCRVEFSRSAERRDCDVVVAEERGDDFLFDLDVPLILDASSDLWSRHPDRDRFAALAERAAAIVVDSEPLAAIAAQYNSEVLVIPASLDVHGHEHVLQPVGRDGPQRKAVCVDAAADVDGLTALIPVLREHRFRLRIITTDDHRLRGLAEGHADLIEVRPWALASVDADVAQCSVGLAFAASGTRSARSHVLKYLALGLRPVCDEVAGVADIEAALGTRIAVCTPADWHAMLAASVVVDRERAAAVLRQYAPPRLAARWKALIDAVVR
jgi:hypothetical protein